MTKINKTHVKRLRKWAEFVANIPSEQFDIRVYTSFVTTNQFGASEISHPEQYATMGRLSRSLSARAASKEAIIGTAMKCGFAGCAIGWLPIAFPRRFAYRDRDIVFRADGGTEMSAFGRSDVYPYFFGIPSYVVEKIIYGFLYREAEIDGDGKVPNDVVALRISTIADIVEAFIGDDEILDDWWEDMTTETVVEFRRKILKALKRVKKIRGKKETQNA